MFILSVKNGPFLLKWVVFNFKPPFVIKLKGFRNIFYTKEVMNSAQYHEEDFFVQVNYRDDKILPFQRQLSNIALLFAIRLVWPITADRNV